MIKLRDYQEAAAHALRVGIAEKRTNQILCAPTGAGKCLGRDTPVLMFDGRVVPVQLIVPGDAIMGPDSTPRRVLSTARGTGPLYRVRPNKGDAYVVNDAHVLSLRITRGATKWDCSRSDTYRADKIHNVTVTEYLSRSATFRHCAKGWRVGVDFAPALPLPRPAYFLGAWLGDGLSEHPAVCSADQEILDACGALAAQFGLALRIETQQDNKSVVAHITTGQRGGRPINAVRDWLADLGVLGDKHIPRAYLTASRADRFELLAGLLDTDGAASRGGFDFVQKNESIARDTAFLARSLGLAAYVAPSRKTCANNGVAGDYWRVSISGDCALVPVRLARRRPAPRAINKNPLLVGLSIEPIGVGEYFGFEIDGDRLFLLGDFTVTHNTVIAAYLMDAVHQKGKRALFVVDRLTLVDQTSAVFDSYGISHGVLQASHWRTRGYERVQVCSAQTLARREWPEADMIVVDEAHTVHEATRRVIERRAVPTIGLTATPFTKGLGKLYDGLVNVTTTTDLIGRGYLANFRIFAASEPDMTGVKVVAGEWDEKETSKRALEVVGDCVHEYAKHGAGRKFICSAVDTAHVDELYRQFMLAGVHVAAYTYKVKDEERAAIVTEFRKPDSVIRGLITVTAATKGFDVPDIGVVIMARPLRKSLAEHIQFFGRGLRAHPGKTECLVLDHSGNSRRFWREWTSFFDRGATELDDGKKKPKPKAQEDGEDAVMKCPVCAYLHMPRPSCPACGHEYPKRPGVQHIKGSLAELVASGNGAALTRELWPSVVSYAQRFRDGDAARRMALALYKDLTGTWPTRRFEEVEPGAEIEPALFNKIRSLQIRFAHRKARP